MSSVTETSTDSMENAYQEYRRTCYSLLYRDAREQGLIDVLAEPRSHADVMSDWCEGGDPSTVRRLLDALARYGAVTVDGDRYQRDESFTEQDPDVGLMATAVGAEHAEALVHSQSYGNIVKVAKNGDNTVQAAFKSTNVGVWDEFLTLPFYEKFRVAAVDAVAANCPASGGRLLDAACGLGHGLVELAARVPSDTRLVGAEISHDFAGLAIERTSDRPNTTVARLDVQTGLDIFEPSSFDGALIVGAWHFLTDPGASLSGFSRLLREGGVLAIGYFFSTVDTADRPLMDLRLRLREPVAQDTDLDDLSAMAQKVDLTLVEHFTVGAFLFTKFQKTTT